MAHVDYFLKIEGIDGESADAKHKGDIQLESFSWGETNSGSHSSGGGGGAGKVSMQDFSFTVHIFKEGDVFVAYVPALDVSGTALRLHKMRYSL